MQTYVSRRNFVVGSAAALAVAAGASAAYARIPTNASSSAGSSEYPTSVDDDPYFAKPDPITDIAQVYDYDVVVVGAGASGVPAACAAVDNGAHVALITKSPRVYSHGVSFSGWNAPSVVEQLGETTPEEIRAYKVDFLEQNHYGVQTGLLNRFFDEVSEAMEWLIQEIISVGRPVSFIAVTDAEPSARRVRFTDQISLTFASVADDYIANKGLDFYPSTPGLQLVQDETGAVSGVIAQDRDGNYLQFNAAKGVILAAGGYGGNKELIARWMPEGMHYTNGCYPEDNTGDGPLMAIWAGAEVCPLKSKKIDLRFRGDHSGRTNIEKLAFLMVNDQGVRIGNENCEEMWHCNYVSMNPSEGDSYYCIFDGKYADVLSANGKDSAILSEEQEAEYMDFPEPILWKADTLEELAEQIGVPTETFLATCAHYSELAEAGDDPDFFKEPEWLYTIDTPPYYAMVREYAIGGTLGAIRVTDNCQAVSRTTGEGIPGLYIVGNDMGGLQTGQNYVGRADGITVTSAATFGYATGRDLARA